MKKAGLFLTLLLLPVLGFSQEAAPQGSHMAQFFIGPRIPYGNGANSTWGFRAGIVLLFPK
jgi:hypothetical protein